MNGDNVVSLDVTANSMADEVLNNTIKKINDVGKAADNASKNTALMRSNANNIFKRLTAEAELAAKKTNKVSDSLRRMFETQAQASKRLRSERLRHLSVEQQLDKLRERELRVEKALKRENLSDYRRAALGARLSQLRTGILQVAPHVKPPILEKPPVLPAKQSFMASLTGYAAGAARGLGLERYGGLIGRFGIGAAALYGGYRVVRGAISNAMDLTAQANAAGLTTEQYQAMQRASKRSNLDPGIAQGAFDKFQDARSKALAGSTEMQQAFKSMGVSVAELSTSEGFRLFQKFLENLGTKKNDAIALANAFKVIGENADKFTNRFSDELNRQGGVSAGTTAELNRAGQVASSGAQGVQNFGSSLVAGGIKNIRRAVGFGVGLLGHLPGRVGEYYRNKAESLNEDPDITAANKAEAEEGMKQRAIWAAQRAKQRSSASRLKEFELERLQQQFEMLSSSMAPERKLSGLSQVGLYTARNSKSYAQGGVQSIPQKQLDRLTEIKDKIIILEQTIKEGLGQ